MSKIIITVMLLSWGCPAQPKKVVTKPEEFNRNVEIHDNYCELTPEAYDCQLEE